MVVQTKSEEKLKICSLCEFKSDDWKCEVSGENLFLASKDESITCPQKKWDKGFFPTSPEAKQELQQLSLKKHEGMDEMGAIKISEFSREAFSAQFKKKNLEILPHKNLLTPRSSIEDILFCIEKFPPGGWSGSIHKWDNVQEAYRQLMQKNISEVQKLLYPEDRFAGKGIVICGGGTKYYPSLYVNIRMLRLLGCHLPVEVYYIGEAEMDDTMISILESIGNTKCINGKTLEDKYPIRIHGGWESKVYSIINSSFEEVLFMDADNTPLVNPEYLFDEKKYLDLGAILWPDYESWKHDENLWKILGIKYRKELQIESGQVLINKKKSWHQINAAKYFCDYSDYYFKHFYGDKEAFHFGWRVTDGDYASPPGPDWIENAIIVQKDIIGSWVFSHRAQAKFKLNKTHKKCMSMPYEKDTLELLDELSTIWNGKIWFTDKVNNELIGTYIYNRISLDSRKLEFIKDGLIGLGSDKMERKWSLVNNKLSIYGDSGLTALLEWNQEKNCWFGKWLDYEKCDVELRKI